ncbi:hypothetical protein [Rhodococcus sp. AG1013]|uniref:hypothetical protein n=1 Tax=unclassified Rhodococcus (in: high G+C Gram-positive bacteria) TaxID=192944 RepID=UPI000E0B0B21|nr:hypothetical protein [Rhodococcus sp. AG1013]RDI23214.1 hypothetical protein DEU38_11278 [Rhodococcus sp. AG1013]
MARVAVLGAAPAVQGYALAGALVLAAPDDAAVRAAWESIPDDVAVVVVTAAAARALAPDLLRGERPLAVVMP